MSAEARHLYAFGEFLLDTREHLLTCRGEPVRLAPKAFDILLLLVQNAGKLVEKDVVLRQVWPDTFVEEGNLAKHISMLRRALSETANGGEYIETVPKRGYRFVAVLGNCANGGATAVGVQPTPAASRENVRESASRWSLTKRLSMLGAVLVSVSAMALIWMVMPAPAPRVVGTTQLTHSGRPRWVQKIVTDGVRLYLGERIGGQQVVAWVPVDGGDPTPIPTPFTNTVLLDISPDHTRLLLASYEGEEDEGPLWVAPVTGGSPERLGSLVASDAAWLPDGQRILLARGTGLYVVGKDGTEGKRVASLNGRPGHFRWSPDGRMLRFTVENVQTSAVAIWEASPDGTHAHAWRAVSNQPKAGFLMGECCGVWTPDGRYFVYRSSQPGTVGLWASRERIGLPGRFANKPLLLHTWPSYAAFFTSLVAPDGKHIFFVGDQDSRELVRYDAGTKRFVPYLSGVVARRADFSRDGNWMTYYTPDYRLWRSRIDGTDRLQLTFGSLNAGPPRWSPDGTRIAFRGDLSDESRIYVVPRDGGSPEPVSAAEFSHADNPCWLPDGNSLIFGRMPGPGLKKEDYAIYRVDLRTRRGDELPGSGGLRPQDISPDGKTIAAFTDDSTRLVLFSPESRRSIDLASGKALYGAFWSRDGKYIYFQDLGGGIEQPIFRVRTSDHKIEPVAAFGQFARADAVSFSLAGLTPDGSPLASLVLARGDLYALDIQVP
jgi:DNA-binding winged helix-turn-helix (wHTH) protein/Tol biopolymer transport system component